jgi:hypothetical protein
MMHAGLGREPPLHVEYVHLGATLCVIHEIMTEAVLSHPSVMLSRKIAIMKAFSKVIWIQNDLFARWCVRDGEEYTNQVDYGMMDKEGYLNGKKILHEDGSSEAPSDTDRKSTSSEGQLTCPFASMASRMNELQVEGK